MAEIVDPVGDPIALIVVEAAVCADKAIPSNHAVGKI